MCGTYKTDPSVESRVTAVETGDGRRFLVIQFRIREWSTLVLQHEAASGLWIPRKEIPGNLDPVSAVTGLLLGPQQLPHPIEQLKSQLAIERRTSWELRKELRKVRERSAELTRKRGGRVRRNS